MASEQATREQQVMVLVLEGKSDKEIADQLGISPTTVKRNIDKHVQGLANQADKPLS